jgi:hypothetical protein
MRGLRKVGCGRWGRRGDSYRVGWRFYGGGRVDVGGGEAGGEEEGKEAPYFGNLRDILQAMSFHDKQSTPVTNDTDYLNIILRRLQVCRTYKPRFGQGQATGFSLAEFQTLYNDDLFYSSFGLNSPLVYAAHRAAGGITSICRQIGIGCEELFRRALQDQYGLQPEQVRWSYTIASESGKTRRLSLDARLEFTDIGDTAKQRQLRDWLQIAAQEVGVSPQIAAVLRGIVFEVRQGYKSKDSKRQNADIGNASTAYSQGYLPVAVILSGQIDQDIIHRYRAQRWLILRGIGQGSTTESSFAFMREIIGWDLQAFLQRNQDHLQSEMQAILEALLSHE